MKRLLLLTTLIVATQTLADGPMRLFPYADETGSTAGMGYESNAGMGYEAPDYGTQTGIGYQTSGTTGSLGGIGYETSTTGGRGYQAPEMSGMGYQAPDYETQAGIGYETPSTTGMQGGMGYEVTEPEL